MTTTLSTPGSEPREAAAIAESQRLAALESLRILDTEPEERFDRITRLARRLFDAPIALVSLVDARRQWFKSALGLRAAESSRNDPMCKQMMASPEVLLVPDVEADERFEAGAPVLGESGIRFYAGFPLRAATGATLGTLCVLDRRPRHFSSDDVQMLRDLAHLAEQELAGHALATMDDLTGVSNRRGFVTLARHALDLCRRVGRPATLLVFDLDEFKAINDTMGHSEGDRALAAFAGVLKRTLRDSDVIGRLGGDEFVALLTNADETQQGCAVARLRDAVKRYNAEGRAAHWLRFSVGSVTFDAARHSGIEQMFDEADRLMYENKRATRSAR